jgi:TolB protein
MTGSVAAAALAGSATLAITLGAQATASADRVLASGVIAFEKRASGGPPEIWLVNADGSNERRLASGCCFDWSPDGRQIAYLDGEAIRVVELDGSGSRRIASSVNESGQELDWSPDGTRIAVEGERGILLVDPHSGASSYATSGRSDGSPRWSPNGKRIVFDRHLDEGGHNGTDVFVVNADGSGLRRLTRELGHDSAYWAPGGRRIAFTGWVERDGDWNSEIYVMDADGSDQQSLTNTPGVSEGRPVWSPGGAKILFSAGKAVYTINPSGKRYRKLPGRASQAQWSPDGASIVFARPRDSRGRLDIWVMSATGRNPVNLTKSSRKTHNRLPLWAPARR